MTGTHQFPYGGARHRIIRAYIGIGLTAVLGFAAIVWWVSRLLAAVTAGDPLAGLILDTVVLLGLGSYLLWTSFLSLCNVFVTTALITITPDQLELVTVTGWTSSLVRDAVRTDDAVSVLFRLGAARSLLKIRRRPAPAIFVPLDRLTGHQTIYRMVARMYVGAKARYGFLITPDHADNETLLDHLSIKKGGSHE